MAPRDAFGNEIRERDAEAAFGASASASDGAATPRSSRPRERKGSRPPRPRSSREAGPGRGRVIVGVVVVVIGLNLVGALLGLVGGDDATTTTTSSAPARPEATAPQRPVDDDDLAAVQLPERAMYAEPRFRAALAAIDEADLGEVFSLTAREDRVTAIMVDAEGSSRFARVEADAPETVEQSEASAAYGGQDTVALDTIDVSAPERLARGYAASTERDLSELSYLIFQTTGTGWSAYSTLENERRVRGDENGRLRG